MKKLFYILIAISLFHNFAFGQWVQQSSGVSVGLTDVQFINPNTGWICGINGTILKTTNAGQNWLIQSSGVTETLYDIHAIDLNVVYCVGIFETILKTTNGGNNWIIIRGNVNPGKFFYGLNFININTGWICGSGQWVLRTTNGGNTFDSSFVPVTFYDVFFKNSMDGLIAGQTGNLYKSSNGGINWIQINVFTETAEFFELSIIGDIGWLIGTQTRKIYKTTNFGTSWDSIGRINGTNSWLSSIFFSSLSTGWACGDSGKIYKSTNGGINWFQQVVPITVGYGPSYFTNDSTGWAIGSIGTIIHTTTGGQIVGVTASENEIPIKFQLQQNYPNPFNPQTKLKFEIPQESSVMLIIYDLLGREVVKLVDEDLRSGEYSVTLNANNLPSGIYLAKLTAFSKNAEYSRTQKLVLLK